MTALARLFGVLRLAVRRLDGEEEDETLGVVFVYRGWERATGTPV